MMGIPLLALPPGSRTPYMIGQLEGERIEILGGHTVLRILASGSETDGRLAVYYATAPPSDACGFSPQPEAYNAFIVTKGYLRFLVGDKCREMYPGDFVFVPPDTPYSYQPLAPYTEFLSLSTPGSLVELFRAIGKEFTGILLPEIGGDTSCETPTTSSFNFGVERIQALLDSSDWLDTDAKIPPSTGPYFLRANTGPCWAFGGVTSRPLVRATQCDGRFSASVMHSSSAYQIRPFFDRYISFTSVDHCFCMIGGDLRVKLKGESEWTLIKEGQTMVIPAREFFTVDISSKLTSLIVFTNGTGMDELIQRAGYECKSAILPNTIGNWDGWDEARLKSACAEVGAQIE